MAKPKDKNKGSSKKLTVKKDRVKDLAPRDRQTKDVMGGFEPATGRKYR